MRTFPHWTFANWKVPPVESLSHASGVPAPFYKGASGVPPVAMRTIIFYKSLLPLQCPVTLPGGNRGNAPKPPGPLRGCLGTPEAGGFRRQRLRNFLPIPYSLFPKNLSTLDF